MKFRETIYPYNFDFENEKLLQHWHITRFLNQLQSKELIALNFQDGQLLLQFNGIFRGLGFKRYHFERKNAESAQRTLRELSRGLTRFKKTNRSNSKIGINFYIDTLKNEDRNSEVIDVIIKFKGLIAFLKTTGVQYLERIGHDELTNCYVSPILLSYWVERWDKYNGSTFDEGFWESVTYNGDVRSLEGKLVDLREYWSRGESLAGLRVYFPQQSYVLIQDVTEPFELQLRFTNYHVEYFTSENLFSINSLRDYVEGRRLSLIHIMPHFLIYHVHNFNTDDDFTHYLEWSIYRSQNELSDYTSSIRYTSGLRFTRGAVISSQASRYQQFLNLVLWNPTHFVFSSRSSDYLQWQGILTHAFHQFELEFVDFEYTIEGMYPSPQILRDYVSLQLQSLTHVNERTERIIDLLRNYLDISYDAEFPQPIVQLLGRVSSSVQKPLPTIFSEVPSGDELHSTFLPFIQFVQARISNDKFKNQRAGMRRSLLGAITTPIYTVDKPVAQVRDVLKRIKQIRESEYLRVLMKRVVPIDLNRVFQEISELLLQDNEITVSFWFGLLLHCTANDANIENISSDNDDDPVTYGLECTLKRSMLNRSSVIINSSTPKLLSVFDSIFHYWSSLNSARVTVRLPYIQNCLRRVLILGAVGAGDPVGEMLQQYFHSSVTQVGAFGTGKVIRAEVSHFEFNVSYTCILSDLDMGGVETALDLDNFLSNIIIKYMRNIQPKLGIFKINYSSALMMHYILNYLQREFLYFYNYTISFITPQFGKVANYEKYLVFIEFDNTQHQGRFLSLNDNETVLYNDVIPLPNLEHQCLDDEDFSNFSKNEFPRTYFFITSRTTQIRDVLTVLSHRADRIITSKSFGSDSVSYYATMNPVRVRLCLRIPNLLKMTSQLSERFNVEQFANSNYTFERENRTLSLGNFYRELTRIQILAHDQGVETLSSLSVFTTIENNYHYVGVGDERARNILCVPPLSPYTIYDKRTYPQIEIFNIKCVDQYFPFHDLDAIDTLILDEYNRHQKKLKFFFTFMIFNKALTRELLLARLLTLATMMSKHRDMIQCIYFNTYLEFFGLPNRRSITLDQPYLIFDDITITAKQNENEIDIYGTFSKNYDLVQLLKYEEIQRIADDLNVALTTLPLHANHVNFALWNLGISPSAFDFTGITIASEFCPMLKFE
uniref:VP4 n=1 Tax=Shelly beach virus TaxID=2485878 RepID=A0A3G3BTK2_9VIRU|nr:VP4 [Shelly beach virus]